LESSNFNIVKHSSHWGFISSIYSLNVSGNLNLNLKL